MSQIFSKTEFDIVCRPGIASLSCHFGRALNEAFKPLGLNHQPLHHVLTLGTFQRTKKEELNENKIAIEMFEPGIDRAFSL